MHSTVVVLLSLCCIGWSHDITIGSTDGRKIFDEVRQANPAIWRQYENVTVIAPDDELIGKVVVTDMRPEKDGDVQIVDGGAGKKSVTIELQSPTVLRGYEFHIEVYSVPETVATDAEEDMTFTQSNENKEQPESEEEKRVEKTTQLPDDATNKDVKNDSMVVEGDVNTNIRPSRETDDNDSLTNIPEESTTTISYETSNSESEESEAKTTEIPETLEEPTPPAANVDNIGPAREIVLHTSVIASGSPDYTDSAESEVKTSETASTATTTDANGEAKDATTEAVVPSSQQSESFEYTTFTPIPYESVKNTPDYPSLSILDYIKNRESMRPIRRTEDENHEDNVETMQSDENDKNIDATTPIAEETSSIEPDDDTVDLVPPKEDASYNTDFTDSAETTVNPVEGSTLNNVPRAGRGINFDASNAEEITPTPDKTEETTPINTDEVNTTPASVHATTVTSDEDITTITSEDHTEIALQDQARNARGASVDNDVNISEETPETTLPTEEIPSGEITEKQANVIIVNMDELMGKDGNHKFVYTIPIVLVINSENRFPIIKIIAEDATVERDNEESRHFQMQPSDESLEPDEYDYKGTENHRVEKTSDDY